MNLEKTDPGLNFFDFSFFDNSVASFIIPSQMWFPVLFDHMYELIEMEFRFQLSKETSLMSHIEQQFT